MMTTRARARGEIDVRVTYGLGGSVVGRFDRTDLEGVPARVLVERVLEHTQQPGPAARTADVLTEVLRGSREIDVELGDESGESDAGAPITLDQVVLKDRDGARDGGALVDAERDELTIRISESYRGGAAWSAGSRVS